MSAAISSSSAALIDRQVLQKRKSPGRLLSPGFLFLKRFPSKVPIGASGSLILVELQAKLQLPDGFIRRPQSFHAVPAEVMRGVHMFLRAAQRAERSDRRGCPVPVRMIFAKP